MGGWIALGIYAVALFVTVCVANWIERGSNQ